MSGLVARIAKRIAISRTIDALERWLAAMPLNDRKTINGVILTILGVILQLVPDSSSWLGPIFDALHALPAVEFTGAGILLAMIGLFHRFLKWVKARYIERDEMEIPQNVQGRYLRERSSQVDFQRDGDR